MVHANLPETNKKGSSLLVSIVVPVYNCPHCIAATLRSILAQSFTDYEIILVNDGSSDTALLEQALSPFLSFLRYFKQENQGPGAARNRGVEEARGYYVAFLDADDLWLPCHLANQAQILQNNANLVLVYANWFVLHGNALIERAFDRKPQSVPVTLDRLL